MPKRSALKTMVGMSFFEFILSASFLYLQKTNRKMAPKMQRHHIITGVGSAMNLPKAPDVLISKVANVSKSKWLLCWFFI